MSRLTQGSACYGNSYAYGAVTLFDPAFQTGSAYRCHTLWRPYNPQPAKTGRVWAIPISLATTLEITIVFSSSGY